MYAKGLSMIVNGERLTYFHPMSYRMHYGWRIQYYNQTIFEETVGIFQWMGSEINRASNDFQIWVGNMIQFPYTSYVSKLPFKKKVVFCWLYFKIKKNLVIDKTTQRIRNSINAVLNKVQGTINRGFMNYQQKRHTICIRDVTRQRDFMRANIVHVPIH